jgi:hypothetical protein
LIRSEATVQGTLTLSAPAYAPTSEGWKLFNPSRDAVTVFKLDSLQFTSFVQSGPLSWLVYAETKLSNQSTPDCLNDGSSFYVTIKSDTNSIRDVEMHPMPSQPPITWCYDAFPPYAATQNAVTRRYSRSTDVIIKVRFNVLVRAENASVWNQHLQGYIVNASVVDVVPVTPTKGMADQWLVSVKVNTSNHLGVGETRTPYSFVTPGHIARSATGLWNLPSLPAVTVSFLYDPEAIGVELSTKSQAVSDVFYVNFNFTAPVAYFSKADVKFDAGPAPADMMGWECAPFPSRYQPTWCRLWWKVSSNIKRSISIQVPQQQLRSVDGRHYSEISNHLQMVYDPTVLKASFEPLWPKQGMESQVTSHSPMLMKLHLNQKAFASDTCFGEESLHSTSCITVSSYPPSPSTATKRPGWNCTDLSACKHGNVTWRLLNVTYENASKAEYVTGALLSVVPSGRCCEVVVSVAENTLKGLSSGFHLRFIRLTISGYLYQKS